MENIKRFIGLICVILKYNINKIPLGIICGLIGCTITQAPQPDYEALYRDLLYPSVRITTADGCGSGVILSNEQLAMSKEQVTQNVQCSLLNAHSIYVLTAAHVVGDEGLVSVELFDSAKTLPAFVVTTDTVKDLALLHLVLTNNQQLKTNIYQARLAPKDYVPKIFTPIWLIGCPLGETPRPTYGQITAVTGSDYWQTNAPIALGNSGGGVFLADTHELIGIAVWVRMYRGQFINHMAGIVSLQTIYKFLENIERR